MSGGVNRTAFRVAACVALLVAATLALTACGGDDGDDGSSGKSSDGSTASDKGDGAAGGGEGQSINENVPTNDEGVQLVDFKFRGNGKSAAFGFPKRFADPGRLAEITLTNESKEPAELQLIRVTGFHVPQEVNKALGRAIEGKAFPKWLFAAGGPGETQPGESKTVTQVLRPGAYFAYNAGAGLATQVALEVRGKEAGDELPEADATVSAIEYGFELDGVSSGETEVALVNDGAQPHHLAISELAGDSTAEDVELYFKSEKGKSPLVEGTTQSTAVVEGGESQLIDLDLESGRYAFYCVISDRQGGPPHVLQGMVDEFEIE